MQLSIGATRNGSEQKKPGIGRKNLPEANGTKFDSNPSPAAKFESSSNTNCQRRVV
jgi:hypothetical protein